MCPRLVFPGEMKCNQLRPRLPRSCASKSVRAAGGAALLVAKIVRIKPCIAKYAVVQAVTTKSWGTKGVVQRGIARRQAGRKSATRWRHVAEGWAPAAEQG